MRPQQKLLYFLIVFLMLQSAIIQAQDASILTNEAVIDMVEKKLPNSIIIKKIQTDANKFDLSTDAIVLLSGANVPEEIITAMMEAEGNKAGEHHELVKKFDEPGIYYLLDDDSDVKYLAPTVIDKIKEGSFGSHMAGALTAAAKKKKKAMIAGTAANLTTSNKPVFFFYFGNNEDATVANQTQHNPNDPMAMLQAMKSMTTGQRIKFSGISSPNEIRLVKPDVDKKERSFVASASSGMVREAGIDSNFVMQIRNDRLAPGLYKVYCDQTLEPGQYLFVYAGSDIYPGQHVYDFMVK